jgi:hypothetical protein
MKKYLYRFGYCTPAQWAANDAQGWDDESSGAFFVEADTSGDALLRGREVAAAFVAKVFRDDGYSEPVAWADAEFSDWIEDGVGDFSEVELQNLPVVRRDELPDFKSWRGS